MTITRIVIIITTVTVPPTIRTGHFFIRTSISIIVSAVIDITAHTATVTTVDTGIDQSGRSQPGRGHECHGHFFLKIRMKLYAGIDFPSNHYYKIDTIYH